MNEAINEAINFLQGVVAEKGRRIFFGFKITNW